MIELELSLFDAQDMTWGEFQIRLHGYKRKEENEWRKFRKVAFNAMIGSHLNPKKLPSTESKFMSIGNDIVIKEASEAHRDKYRDAMKRFVEQREANKK